MSFRECKWCGAEAHAGLNECYDCLNDSTAYLIDKIKEEAIRIDIERGASD
jgi:hypothetical protein